MSDPGFTTSAEVARMLRNEADKRVERLKRALETCIESNGYKPRDPIGRYCSAIGLDVRISKGAGLEFGPADALSLSHKIDQTPMPDTLRRYYD